MKAKPKKPSQSEKLLWNAAVKATLTELIKYDGIIPDKEDRNFLFQAITNKVAYKSKS